MNQLIPVLLNQLRINNRELVEKGAECLGNLAEAGGQVTAEVIDKSLNMAITWLHEDTNPRSTDIKKYSAVLILREFCSKQSVITFKLIRIHGMGTLPQIMFGWRGNRPILYQPTFARLW